MTYVHTKTWTRLFITILFIIMKTWKQWRYPSTDKWINKLWYIHKMIYYLMLKRNELSRQENTWKKVRYILLGAKDNLKKDTHCIIPAIWKRQTMEILRKIIVAKNSKEGKMGGAKENFRAVKWFFCNTPTVYICHNTYVKTQCTTHRVNLNLNYELSLILMYQYWLIVSNISP